MDHQQNIFWYKVHGTTRYGVINLQTCDTQLIWLPMETPRYRQLMYQNGLTDLSEIWNQGFLGDDASFGVKIFILRNQTM